MDYNYEKMIVEMLLRVKSKRQLKKIYDYICFVYLKNQTKAELTL